MTRLDVEPSLQGAVIRYPRAWITVSEYNYDIAERSFYYEPDGKRLGAFSAPCLRQIAAAFRETLVQSRAKVDRTV
jgi:hypothetical protein